MLSPCRASSERFAPPPWYSAPVVEQHRARRHLRRHGVVLGEDLGSSDVWLSRMTRVAPLASVKSVTAQMVLHCTS